MSEELGGYLQQQDLSDEIVDAMHMGADLWALKVGGGAKPNDCPYSELKDWVLQVLRRRHLITEQGIEILKREGL